MSVGTFGVANYVSTSLSAVDRVTAFVNPGISGVDTTAAVFTPVSLFSAPYPRASGFTPLLNQPFYVRQTFNAPATNSAAAGDPIGLWLPSQSPADVTNLLLWSDDFDTATWNKYSTCTVTANVAADPDSVPVADLLTATGADGVCSQDVTVSASTNYTFSVWLRAGSATTLTIFLFTTGFATLSSTVCNVTTSWQQFTVQANSGVNTTIRVAIGGGSTFSSPEAVFASRAQLNLGSTALTYQPNAGCLGGSNRRTGGANLLLWTTSYSQSFWTLNNVTNSEKTGTAASGQKIDVITGAAGSSLKLLRPTANVTILAGGTYSVQFKVQYSTHRYVSLTFDDAATTNGCWTAFDLLNGTISRSAIAYGTGTAVASTITSLGGTDYLITLTGTAGSSATGARIALSLQDSGTSQFNNSSSTGSLGVWDAGMNIGALATYSRNMDQIGGLLLSASLFQSTSANRGTLARRPLSGIRNLIRNNTMQGAVAGTPGTQPNNWATTPTGGSITRTIVGTGTESEITYIDIRYVFSAGAIATVQYEQGTQIAAANGQTWTQSAYVKLTGGSLTNISEVRNGISENDVGGTFLAGDTTAFTPTTGALSGQRYTHTRTLNNASTVFVVGTTQIVATGAADITLRIGLPQLERGSSATTVQRASSASDITESDQPNVWHTLWDGISDFGTFGVQSFGSASLFAAAGQAWTVWGVFRTTDTTNNLALIAKASATSANRTLQLFRDAGTSQIAVICRGTSSTYGDILTTGQFAVWALRWNESSLQLYVNRSSPVTVTVGTAAEEAQDITVAVRTSASPAGHFNGHNDVAMIDRALTDGEIATLMGNLNTTYRSGL